MSHTFRKGYNRFKPDQNELLKCSPDGTRPGVHEKYRCPACSNRKKLKLLRKSVDLENK